MTDWIFPTASFALKHHKEIEVASSKLISLILGSKSNIAITGLPGSGKTDLLNHLTNNMASRSAKPVSESIRAESGVVKQGRTRLRLTTVPGQQSRYKLEAIDTLFNPETPVDGVIHVVSNGFVTLRSRTIQELLMKKHPETKTIKGYCAHHRNLELDDLKITAALLRGCLLRGNRPQWLALVCTKIDLYSEEFQPVHDYYLDENSPFRGVLNGLESDVGRARFKWFSLPACATLQDFTWNKLTVPSTGVNEMQRNSLIHSILASIAKGAPDVD